jgi:hypothetical protein
MVADKKILLLDTERGAAAFKSMPNVTILDMYNTAGGSQSNLIDAVDRTFWSLMKNPEKLAPYSHLVIDSVTALCSTTRADIILDPDKTQPGDLWRKRGLYSADSRGDYRAMNDMVARLLRWYRDLPIPTIFTTHEEDREDMTGAMKRGPSLSPGLLKDSLVWSHVIAHLGFTIKPVKVDGQIIPAGTRRLRIVPDAKYIAKSKQRVDLPPLPPAIINPQLSDLFKIMEHTGQPYPWVIVYGAPGVGKTSLVLGAQYKQGKSDMEEVIEEEGKTVEVKRE